MKIKDYDRYDQQTIEYFERNDGRRYRFSGSKRHISYIHERVSIGFAGWWSVQLPLSNYSVEVGVGDIA
jgi:hypothetical protein